MDSKMTPAQWRKLASALVFRKLQLQDDLKNEDYRAVASIEYSKHNQIDAINTLMEQIPYEFIPAPAESETK